MQNLLTLVWPVDELLFINGILLSLAVVLLPNVSWATTQTAKNCSKLFSEFNTQFNSQASKSSSFFARQFNNVHDRSSYYIDAINLFARSPDRFALMRYDRAGKDILKRLRGISEKFDVLIVDPGVALRLDLFELFVRQNRLFDRDPWKVRQSFAESLGKRKVYRALALDKTEPEKIRIQGMKSKMMLNFARYAEDYRTFALQDFILGNVQEQLLQRMEKNNSWDVWLSVSELPDVALSVAKDWAKPGQKIYLFELEISEIDLIYLGTDNFLPYPTKWQKVKVHAEGKTNTYTVDLDRVVESFVSFQIFPSEIKSVKEVNFEDIVKINWLYQ